MADGLYLERVHGAVLRDVVIEFESPRKEWFGKCLTMDAETAAAGVIGADNIRCING